MVFTKGDAPYSESLGSYYAAQEGDLHPSCIVKPEAVIDVSIALKSLSAFDGPKCHFAIRGGGHTPFAGSANIARGVTIDLQAINKVTLSDDNSTTSVGGGARWADVYKKLDPLDLAVGGGRADLVGVGGLTTGGLLPLLLTWRNLNLTSLRRHIVFFTSPRICLRQRAELRSGAGKWHYPECQSSKLFGSVESSPWRFEQLRNRDSVRPRHISARQILGRRHNL